jgi:hypothetical protein
LDFPPQPTAGPWMEPSILGRNFDLRPALSRVDFRSIGAGAHLMTWCTLSHRIGITGLRLSHVTSRLTTIWCRSDGWVCGWASAPMLTQYITCSIWFL